MRLNVAFVILGFHALGSVAAPHAVVRRQVKEPRDSYDFIIAGGGTAGLTVADRLSEAFPDRTILVVEVGKVDEGVGVFEPPGTRSGADMFNISSLPIKALNGRQAALKLGRVVGGSSVVNGQFFDRGSRQDYDEWMEVAGEAWADSEERWDWEGISPFFRKSVTFTPPAEEDAEEIGYTWDEAAYGGEGPIHSYFPPWQWPITLISWDAWVEAGVNPRIECANGDKDGVCWVPTSQNPVTAKRSHSGIGHFADIIEERSNYDLLTRHKVNRVIYDEDPEKGPPKVEIKDLETDEVQVVAATAEVVISAGGAHTPQILQKSGIAGKKFLQDSGIDVVVDLPGVGWNFQDHAGPRIQSTLAVPVTPDPQTIGYNKTFAQEALDQYKLRPARGPYTLAMGNSAIYVSLPNVTESWQKIVDNVLEQVETPERYLANDVPPEVVAGYKAQLQVLAKSFADPSQPILESPFNVGLSGAAFLLKPLSRGSIFTDAEKPDDPPIIEYGTASNPVDFEVMAEFVHFFRRYFNTPLLQEYGAEEVAPGPDVTTFEEIREFLRDAINPSFMHPCCTAPMMPQNLGGVVGTDLKVYGTKGLRVADASIMSLLPGTHTSATAYAIGEKAADIIIRAWSV